MKKIIYSLIIALFLVASISVKAQNVEFNKENFPKKEKEFKEARANFNQGVKYYELGRGSYLIALDYFLKANTFNPNNAELNYYIGSCYLNTVQKLNSIPYFEKSLTLNPTQFPDTKYLQNQS